MGFWSNLWNSIVSYAKRIWDSIKRIWRAIVRLAVEVVQFFRNLRLDPNKQKPFIGDYSKLKEAIKNTPVKDAGIFRGVYNEVSDSIEVLEGVEANSLDEQTKHVLGSDPLVVLN